MLAAFEPLTLQQDSQINLVGYTSSHLKTDVKKHWAQIALRVIIWELEGATGVASVTNAPYSRVDSVNQPPTLVAEKPRCVHLK